MQACDASDNHAYLLGRFIARLFELQPASVLDVGCGAGALLRACAERGVAARGIESSAKRLAILAEEGLAAQHASATELPFADGEFDWVTMRHVPHHLEDPAAAFREAARVARTGLLIAEPFYDTSLPSQHVALAFDRWIKAEHRRGGMLHMECLSAQELLVALPEEARSETTFESVLRLRARSVQSLSEEAAPYTEQLEANAAELGALTDLEQTASRDGLSWNGSLMLIARL